MFRLSKIIIVIFSILLLLPWRVKANTIFNSNSLNCVGSLSDCDNNFNSVIFGNVNINSNKEITFVGEYVRTNYISNLPSSSINVSTNIQIKNGTLYEVSINTPPYVYNTFLNSRISVSDNNILLLAYRMDSYGNNYSNLSDNPESEYVTKNLGNFESGRFYHLQITYDGINYKIYFDNSLVFEKAIEFSDNSHNLAFMSNGDNNWKDLFITDDPNNPNPVVDNPTPTPNITVKPASVVIIPGFMASWNYDALLHNSNTVTYRSWILAPFVKEYDGIIKTFENLGYTKGVNLFIYPYDWRQKINLNADNLNNFIRENIFDKDPSNNVNIIGHSLGGIIGSYWSEKYDNDKVKKVITVGSPHQGVAQVYKPIEAGEIPRDNSFLWLAEKSLLMINKNKFETDKSTINRVFPVLQDIFPIYDFLKINNKMINVMDMEQKNYFFMDNYSKIGSLQKIQSIASDYHPTLSGYNVKLNNIFDQLIGNYTDGKPISEIKANGDEVVTFASASLYGKNSTEKLGHGELIYKKEAIKKILDGLNVDYKDNQIVEGAGTVISPSLIILIKSPIEVELLFKNTIYNANEGIIFVENAETGKYSLKIKGKEKGDFQIVIGQIANKNEIWSTIDGKISNIKPETQKYTYEIQYSKEINNRNNISNLNKNIFIKNNSAINQLYLKNLQNNIALMKKKFILLHNYSKKNENFMKKRKKFYSKIFF